MSLPRNHPSAVPGVQVDLSQARETARRLAREWNLALGDPFPMSNVSFVAPTADGRVLKVAWGGDDESLHEGAALELWNGRGAVRAFRHEGYAVLEERALPGSDLSVLDDDVATAIAVGIAHLLWLPAQDPFRSVAAKVPGWLEEGEAMGSPLAPLARELFDQVGVSPDWVVHGDFHHHNILQSGNSYVAIDPKPYLADREYDVASFLWNPLGKLMEDRATTERRIAAFVASGLDDFKIRAWSIIRGSYLRPQEPFARALRALLD
ncbi:MAG TPA: aminoglycoside phosphotransferase family protein [Acidimicrobiales bacterium]|jgi:streptomycin 6-kinase